MAKRKPELNKLLETNIKTLRSSLSTVSMAEFVAATVESLMRVERDEHLETAGDDKGNGFYERTFKSMSKNCLMVNVPRTRANNFQPATLELAKMGGEQIDELCLSLYKKGLSGADIQDIIKQMFGGGVSASKVNKLASSFHKFRMAWQNSPLEKSYKVVFADVIFVKVRRGNSYSKEGVYVAYGVREDNKREILVLETNPTEFSEQWGTFFKEMKKRGVEKIDLIVADGLTGLEDEILGLFPGAEFQKCVVHKMRNILKKTRPRDKGEMSEDLKHVFDNFDKDSTLEKALEKVDALLEKWKDVYPNLCNFFGESKEYYFTYIKFDHRVRRMIYTSNSVENINRAIRKATKNKLSFESPAKMMDYIFMVVKEFEEKNFMVYAVSNYKYFKKLTD
jgi:transposase-like protein